MFELDEKPRWGDFGSILMAGFITDRDNSGQAVLMRSGPFVPPVTFPSGICVITKDLRDAMISQGFIGVDCCAVVVKKVVHIEWQEWDKSLPLVSDQLPVSEPEDYISRRRHSPRTAKELPQMFELHPRQDLEFTVAQDETLGLVRDDAKLPTSDLFCSRANTVLVKSHVAEFLRATCEEWCLFKPVSWATHK